MNRLYARRRPVRSGVCFWHPRLSLPLLAAFDFRRRNLPTVRPERVEALKPDADFVKRSCVDGMNTTLTLTAQSDKTNLTQISGMVTSGCDNRPGADRSIDRYPHYGWSVIIER